MSKYIREKQSFFSKAVYDRPYNMHYFHYHDEHEIYYLESGRTKYISANVESDLSLEALSCRFSITPNHLSKQFKKITGVGLNDFINISRVTAAEKLLISTNMSITSVALACGFNDSNYFASVFKKFKGITQKKYSLINK